MSERTEEPALKPIKVDVSAIAIAMQSDSYDAIWFLDIETGQVRLYWDGMLDAEQVDEDFDIDAYLESDQYRQIGGTNSREGYQMMEDFVASLNPGRDKELLAEAIALNKPFRRFKDALDYVGEARNQWFQFQEEAYERLALEWLANEGFEPEAQVQNVE